METKWSSILVADRIREAADTLGRLPEKHPGRRMQSSWPEIVLNPQEAYGYTPIAENSTPPTAGAIDRMDEVLLKWISYLDVEDARVLWSWVLGVPAGIVSKRMNIHRTTVFRRRIGSLKKIAVHLNAEAMPVVPAAEPN